MDTRHSCPLSNVRSSDIPSFGLYQRVLAAVRLRALPAESDFTDARRLPVLLARNLQGQLRFGGRGRQVDDKCTLVVKAEDAQLHVVDADCQPLTFSAEAFQPQGSRIVALHLVAEEAVGASPVNTFVCTVPAIQRSKEVIALRLLLTAEHLVNGLCLQRQQRGK